MQINQINPKIRLIALSFAVSVVLTGVKFLAYVITNSNAILSDALESIINIVASGFAFYSIRLSAQPRDSNHPYGHGKIEFFSAGFEGALIVIASVVIWIGAVERLLVPKALTNLTTGSLLIVLTVAVNAVMGYVLIRRGEKYHSPALTADGRHLLTDVGSSLLLLVSVGAVMLTGYYWIDGAASLLFGALIAYNGFRLIRKSIAGLMDESNPILMDEVVHIIRDHKKEYWVDVHNLRVQQYGADLHIDCHLTLPYYWDLKKSHDAIREFENALKANLQGDTEIFVHSDPCLPECCHFCRVSDCPVRLHAFKHEINWDVVNLAKNQKLFTEASVDSGLGAH